MRIHVLSDLHLEFGHMDPPRVEAGVTVLAGDIHKGDRGIGWAREAFPHRPVLYVAGNHEFYGGAHPRTIEKLKAQAQGSNVTVLEMDEAEIGGFRFLGCTLWTDFSLLGNPTAGKEEAAGVMNDYRQIRVSPAYRKFTPWDAERIHRQSRAWLEQRLQVREKPTVVITHHAPSAQSLEGRRRDLLDVAYATNQEPLILETRPALWIHGHTHHTVDYRIGPTRVVCNPRGYGKTEVSGFQADRLFTLEPNGQLKPNGQEEPAGPQQASRQPDL